VESVAVLAAVALRSLHESSVSQPWSGRAAAAWWPAARHLQAGEDNEPMNTRFLSSFAVTAGTRLIPGVVFLILGAAAFHNH
jgi:hypothetical protein